MGTVSKLERHLTDTDIANILSSSNTTVANKKILDSLIIRMKCKEDLLDLCDQLEKITGSPRMNNIVNDLRNGMCIHTVVNFISKPIIMAVLSPEYLYRF